MPDVFDIALSEIITVFPFVVLALIYLLVLHTPQGGKFAPFSSKLKPGVRVNTKSGIIGCVAKINTTTFILETYDGALIEMHLSAVTEILS